MLTDNQKYFTCKIVKYRETGDLINVSQDRAHDVGLQSKFDIYYNYANEAVWRKR